MILSGAPFKSKSTLLLYPETIVLIAFLLDVKSRVAIFYNFDSIWLSKLKAFLASTADPQSFSAKTLRAASVGSPILLKSLPATSILELLLKVLTVARDLKMSALFFRS